MDQGATRRHMHISAPQAAGSFGNCGLRADRRRCVTWSGHTDLDVEMMEVTVCFQSSAQVMVDGARRDLLNRHRPMLMLLHPPST
jgi:hypothetical protein